MTIYLNENLKKLRQKNKLTQEVLAEFLGVSFQSVSKWERGESYPDITLLPEIADFFKVSVDELLGINKAENETEITKGINEYDHLTDYKLMWEIIKNLKQKFPNDFRILIRYLGCLVRYNENKSAKSAEIIAVYNNIQENCTDDQIRIKAKRCIIEYYRNLAEKENNDISFADCEKIIKEMPKMRDSQEMFCFFYPEDYPARDKNIRNTLEEQFLLLHTVYSHYFFFDERFSDEWILLALNKEIDFLNFIYDDGNYGKMWRSMIYNYGQVGIKYFRLGNNQKALENFKKMCELAIKFDCMDRITVMHSTMFEGKEFDKHTLGSTYIAKSQIKELLTKKFPLSDELKLSSDFKKIIKILE